jgi:hypothetical protein
MDGPFAGALPHLRHGPGGEVSDVDRRNRKTALWLLAVVIALFLLAFFGVTS